MQINRVCFTRTESLKKIKKMRKFVDGTDEIFRVLFDTAQSRKTRKEFE
jgi:hypothetical protein